MDEKKIIVIYRFSECRYSTTEIEFLLPGIIHKHFENNDTLFKELVNTSNIFYNDDKGAGLLKQSYYENLSDFIYMMLINAGAVQSIEKLIVTHYVQETQISKNFDLWLEWRPRW